MVSIHLSDGVVDGGTNHIVLGDNWFISSWNELEFVHVEVEPIAGVMHQPGGVTLLPVDRDHALSVRKKGIRG